MVCIRSQQSAILSECFSIEALAATPRVFRYPLAIDEQGITIRVLSGEEQAEYTQLFAILRATLHARRCSRPRPSLTRISWNTSTGSRHSFVYAVERLRVRGTGAALQAPVMPTHNRRHTLTIRANLSSLLSEMQTSQPRSNTTICSVGEPSPPLSGILNQLPGHAQPGGVTLGEQRIDGNDLASVVIYPTHWYPNDTLSPTLAIPYLYSTSHDFAIVQLRLLVFAERIRQGCSGAEHLDDRPLSREASLMTHGVYRRINLARTETRCSVTLSLRTIKPKVETIPSEIQPSTQHDWNNRDLDRAYNCMGGITTCRATSSISKSRSAIRRSDPAIGPR